MKMEAINPNTAIRNILFVDNDTSITTKIRLWTEKMEIEVKNNLAFSYSIDAQSAIKELGQKNFDLVVLELTLPIVNGYYLIKRIRKEHPNTKIVIYTRLRKPQDLALMATSNVNNIFLKELMPIEDLIEIITNKETSGQIDEIVMELNSQVKTLNSEVTPKQERLIQCQKCHLIIAPDSHFCNNCGQKIPRKTKKALTEKSAPLLENETITNSNENK